MWMWVKQVEIIKKWKYQASKQGKVYKKSKSAIKVYKATKFRQSK